jgi:hypothetical protein
VPWLRIPETLPSFSPPRILTPSGHFISAEIISNIIEYETDRPSKPFLLLFKKWLFDLQSGFELPYKSILRNEPDICTKDNDGRYTGTIEGTNNGTGN